MKSQTKTKVYRIISAFLAINILFEAIAPTCAFALTGGPSQPEVESFTPVGTSDMVDPFTGDFSYNIPLMDVDGYPINIGYNAGVTMDQEASWVGLGWNINPGVINRGMRGIPDDFNGENIVKEFKMKENKTYGFSIGGGLEIFGLGKKKKLPDGTPGAGQLGVGLNYSIGIKHNNYTGYGIDQSFSPSITSGDPAKNHHTMGLGLNSSSDGGLSVQPSYSYSAKIKKGAYKDQSLNFSIGCSFSSRGGLKALSLSTTRTAQVTVTNKEKTKTAEHSISANVASSSFDFGMPTYTPQATLPLQNLSLTGNFKIGFEGSGVHPNLTVGGFYSGQKLTTNTISNPAYGYMNADEGNKYDNALLDFNREKDGTFTTSTPALPITNFTYDIYSVSGQGVSGSYRAFRGDLGHVYDARMNTTSDGYSLGAEIGVGGVFHAGGDFTVNNVDGTSGRWSNGNIAATRLTHKATSKDPLYEKYYFKEANEKTVDADLEFYQKIDGTNATSIYLEKISKFNIIADKYFTSITNPDDSGTEISPDNTRKKRERRNQPLTTLTRSELSALALDDLEAKLNTVGIDPTNAKPYHIGEITTLNSDGARYVYGIAAYNKKQEEVTFATGNNSSGVGRRSPDLATGLVKYFPGDNELSNVSGRDNYFSNTKTPAYAHSYLLTAVLSPDYVDSDYTRGPSKGDIGNYTKLNYDDKVSDYNWRIPVGEKTASYDEGLKSDFSDDKGSYLYGSKDLYYLTSIETKRYIAIFSLSAREDGYGVVDKDGKMANVKPMKKLDKIALYAKEDYARYLRDLQSGVSPLKLPVEIKTVNFEYDYSLCPNVPNNSGKSVTVNTTNINSAKGKLTLKKIYFTYQKSNKARFSPYQFSYSTFNPDYNIKAYDRWGNYKPHLTDQLYSYEYPYVEQNLANANQYAQAWNLKEITLPSGGKIKVEYESDDYAYVQNKQAGQMFKVVGVEDAPIGSTSFNNPTPQGIGTPINLTTANAARLIIKLQTPIVTDPVTNAALTQTQKDAKFQNQYLSGIDYLYFRFLMKIKSGEALPGCNITTLDKQEYVSGYLTKSNFDISKSFVSSNGEYACIHINKTDVDDTPSGLEISPITKAAIQFGRLNMSRDVWSTCPLDDTDGFGEQLANAMLNSSFTKNIKDAIVGVNKSLYNTYNVGKEAIMGKSWIRLNTPGKIKYGGGYRVKQIAITDQWDGTGVSDIVGNSYYGYGQEYIYTTTEDAAPLIPISSGIASYEPQLGGDENPWKIPVFYPAKKVLAPDDEHFMEEPFGESFFPSPSVGYSKVTVRNLKRTNVTHNATGKIVYEYYTAKDFPTITERTKLNAPRKKNNPLNLGALFKLEVKDFITASQGYVIETNDMHGKLKMQSIYQEGQDKPISSVEYVYKKTAYGNGSYRLNNTATVINSNGTVNDNATIGMFMDFVSDMRESSNSTLSTAVQFNTDGILIPPIPTPIPIPIGLPSFSREITQFRSAVVTKVIQRFGILEEIVTKDLGSVVSTKNKAYDAETGDVLLIETVTNFDDYTYTLNYPAYWYYDAMGPAYKNVGFNLSGITFASTGTASNVNDALLYFAEGDEIVLADASASYMRAWVKSVNANSVEAIDREGMPVGGAFVKITRSGRRNQQGLPMASIVTLTNPINNPNNNIQANIYQNVLSAQALEYTNSWKTFCDCYQIGSSVSTGNPYIIGTKGMYKMKKIFSYISGRTQSDYNGNTNIRKDGVYTTYTPFYKMNGSKWEKDGTGWTFISEVTEFSPYGVELENKDALNRYSSAVYSYNQTLAVGLVANSKYKNSGVDNFEDYDLKTCADNHFKFNVETGGIINSNSTSGSNRSSFFNRNKKDDGQQTKSIYYPNIVESTAHTGKYSLKVVPGTPVKMIKQIKQCDYIPCNITVTKDRSCKANYFCYTITGGMPTYQYDWSSNGVEAKVVIAQPDDVNKIYKIYVESTTASYILNLVVTDKNNCKKNVSIDLNTGLVTSL